MGHSPECKSGNVGPEWSGAPNPDNPDEEWICDECGGVIKSEWLLQGLAARRRGMMPVDQGEEFPMPRG
jgi:hypothetical protein